MEETPDRSGRVKFARPGFGLRFLYPVVTPHGQRVEIADEDRDGAHRVHLTASEAGEVDLEVFRMPDLTPADEYRRHKGYLERRFGPGSVSEPTERTLSELPAWSYAFGGSGFERVLSLQVGADLYRLISDPQSPLNDEIVATVRIET